MKLTSELESEERVCVCGEGGGFEIECEYTVDSDQNVCDNK